MLRTVWLTLTSNYTRKRGLFLLRVGKYRETFTFSKFAWQTVEWFYYSRYAFLPTEEFFLCYVTINRNPFRKDSVISNIEAWRQFSELSNIITGTFSERNKTHNQLFHFIQICGWHLVENEIFNFQLSLAIFIPRSLLLPPSPSPGSPLSLSPVKRKMNTGEGISGRQVLYVGTRLPGIIYEFYHKRNWLFRYKDSTSHTLY